jgi:hypothetical protein
MHGFIKTADQWVFAAALLQAALFLARTLLDDLFA